MIHWREAVNEPVYCVKLNLEIRKYPGDGGPDLEPLDG